MKADDETRKGVTRREFIKTAAFTGAVVVAGFPYVVRAAEDRTINIAGMMSLTGPNQFHGRSRDQGVRLAVEEMQPLMKDWKISYRVYDTQTNPGVAKRKATEAIEGGADYLDGAMLASEANAVAEVATEKHKIFTTGSGHTELFGKNCSRLLFKWNAVNFAQIRTPIWYAMENIPGAKSARWAVLTVNFAWGTESRDIFLSYVKEKGYNINLVYDEFFDIKTTDFTGIFNSVQVKKPDVLFMCDVGGTHTISALKQFQIMGLKKKCAVVWGLGNIEAYKAIGPEVSEGTISGSVFWHTLSFPASKAFVKSYNEHFNANPDFNAAGGYQDVKNVLNAVKATGTKDWKALVKFLEGYEYDGLTGRERINPDTHLVEKPYYPLVGKKKEAMKDKDDFVEVKTSPPKELITWTKERSGCKFKEQI